MPLTNIQGNICDKLVDEFDKKYSLTNVAKSAISNTLSSINDDLTGMIWSDPGDLATGINTFNAGASAIIPGDSESDIDDTMAMIQSCDFLKDDELFKNPIALIKGIVGPIYGKLNALANSLGASLGEFLPANALKILTDLFAGQGLVSSMSELDKILNCVDSLCGATYAAKVAEMTGKTSALYTGMKMVDDPTSIDFGKVDLSSVYSTAGLDAAQITAMTNVGDAVTTQKEAAVSQTSSLVDKIKARL